MPAQIQDIYGFMSPGGLLVPLQNQILYAVPSSPTYRVSYGGTYHAMNGQNPNISSAAMKYGVVAQTDSTGQWSFTLPYGATETHPAQPPVRWTLVFPDGSMLSGVVPSVAGPLSVDDLIADYGWTWASQVYVAPVTAGSFAKGTVSFSPGSSTASVVFLSPFVDNTYQITLTSSVDSVDGTIPRVAWSSKTTTGFTVALDTTDATVSVDWAAQL